MTEHDRVRTLLAAAAELAEPAGDPGAELARRGERRRLRRRAAGLTALAALTAVAVAVPLTLTGGTENGAPSRLTTSPSATFPAGPTAAEIAADTWSTLPPGPVPAYAGASVLWTGTHLLVWGGSSGSRGQTFHADGASYDPATRRWRKMAAAPISARDGQAAVWTGREMIVWGGTGGPARPDSSTGAVGDPVTGTGAAYDPATDTWRTLPASPLPAETRVHAVWTGQQVIVLGGSADPTAAAAYDPATNRWRSLPSIPGQGRRQVAAVVPVWTGSELLTFTEWSRSGSGPNGNGVDLAGYSPTTGAWRRIPATAGAVEGVRSAFWTGDDVLVPGEPQFCGYCIGGPQFDLRGHLYHRATNSWQTINHGPVDDVVPTEVWTGSALVAIDYAGEGAVWNPATDAWTSLSQAPYWIDGRAGMVWAGDALLVWGPLYDRGHDQTPAPAAGLRLGPAATTPGTPTVPATVSPSPADSTASAATATPNRQRAEQEAARLLALAQLPPGATNLATVPRSLSGPVMGTPATSSLIDKSRLWRISMPYAEALAFIRAHPPDQLRQSGSSTGSGPNGPSAGYAYTEPDSDAWVQGQLEVGVAALDAHTSAIRADGMTLWLDPRPFRDDAIGQRMRVTIAGGCPGSDSGMVGVTNLGTDLDAAMVPTGDPSAGLLCRYDGLNGTRFGLTAQRHLDAAAARRIAAAGRQVRLSHLDDAAGSCPMGDSSTTVLVLSYPGRADVDLWYARTGCQSLSNGHIRADAGDFGQAAADADG